MKFSKSLALFSLMALCVAALVGCGVMDGFFLPPTDANGVETGPSIAEQVGSAARGLLPGWGDVFNFVLATVIGGAYVKIRTKGRDKAMFALVLDIVKAIQSAKGGKLDYDALYATLADAKALFVNKDKFVKLVNDVKASLDKHLADGFQASDVPEIVKDVEQDFQDVSDIPASTTAAEPAPAPATDPNDPAKPSA